jgi:hypothetical protein
MYPEHMGFEAGCVLIASSVTPRSVADVVARIIARFEAPSGRLIIAPTLPLRDLLVDPGEIPDVGFVALIPERGHIGNDLLAHALRRAFGVPTLALAISSLLQIGAYELCLAPSDVEVDADGRALLRRDQGGSPSAPEELREAGGLTLVGSARVGARTLSFFDAPWLGLEALLARDVRPKEPRSLMEGLFDAAIAAPFAVTVSIAEKGSRVGAARRIYEGREPEVHPWSWGFSLWPATPHVARRRIEILSKELP